MTQPVSGAGARTSKKHVAERKRRPRGAPARHRLEVAAKRYIPVGVAVAAIVALGLGPVVAPANTESASAHVPAAGVDCKKAYVDATAYDAGATLKIVLDGDVVLDTFVFGGEYHWSKTFTAVESKKDHVLTGLIDSKDDNTFDYPINIKTTGCTPPFDFDWQYPAPTCDGVTIPFPADLPKGQQGDVMEVNVTGGSISGMQYKLEGDAYKAKYPNGHAGLTVFIPWSDFRNYSIPKTGVWTVTGLQVHGTNYHWSGNFECGTPPPVSANPAASIAATCGSATVSLSNIQNLSGGKTGTDATFTVKVDGVLTDTVTLKPNEAFTPKKYDFPEDSGDHVVEVFSGTTSLAKKTVLTDCLPPVVVPANPSASLVVTCGTATLSLANLQDLSGGKVGTDATYTVKVDGVLTDTITLKPNQAFVPKVYTFDEDSGDHVVEVFNGSTSLAKKTVLTDCAPPVVVPATPAASIAKECGSATVSLENKQDLSGGKVGTDAVYLVKVDGVRVDTVTLKPNEAFTPKKYDFPEDSGDHVVEVFSGTTSLAKATVLTDCAPPVVVPATPAASIVGVCGSVTVSLSNIQDLTGGKVGTDVTYTVKVDGVLTDTVTLKPNEAFTPKKYDFPEDSGDHVVEVFSGTTSVAKAALSSDCVNIPPAIRQIFGAKIVENEDCFSISYVFSNDVKLEKDGEFAKPADFRYTDEEGKIVPVRVEPNGEPVPVTLTFKKNTGIHTSKVWIVGFEKDTFDVNTDVCDTPTPTPTPTRTGPEGGTDGGQVVITEQSKRQNASVNNARVMQFWTPTTITMLVVLVALMVMALIAANIIRSRRRKNGVSA